MAGIDTQMNFEIVRDAIKALLATYASGRFTVFIGQTLARDALEALDTGRIVELFYSEGDFPDSNNSRQEATHDTVYQIYYTVTKKASANLVKLNDPDATQSEYATALSNAKSAAARADEALDELRRMVCQILKDPVNEQLGLTITGNKKQVSNIRLRNFRKDAPLPQGSVVTVTASERLEIRLSETFTGATPVAPAADTYEIINQFNTQTDPDGATPAQPGITVDAT